MKVIPLLLTCLALSACQRAPQNAAELMDRLPRHFSGQVHWQGEANGQHIRIDTRALAARNEHLLEFNGMNVIRLNPDGSVAMERYAPCRGTISAPGGEILLEDVQGAGEDALKSGTFRGKLSASLQSVDAEWTTSFGTKGSIKLEASSQ